ncbi:MAG TPA: sigma-70 family RNA polymerase sigma factor [Candidatus Polarisedimenticolia bacterium]|nr:sigma-70 family RNA polymerase sigma factor [Candidatus Polarisedimenticolia bacterium]
MDTMNTDRTLMRQVVHRDERAFALLVERYGGRMLAVARRLLGSQADAEDAVQRAFLRCYLGAAGYRVEWAVSTWLYRILTNVCIDEMRRRRSRSTGSEALTRETAAAANGRGDSIDAVARLDVRRALRRVPREARILVTLRYVDGLSYGELARIRGISVNTVKSQLARARSILRGALGGGKGR